MRRPTISEEILSDIDRMEEEHLRLKSRMSVPRATVDESREPSPKHDNTGVDRPPRKDRR